MATQTAFGNESADDALTRISNHYKNRPFRVHLAAWLLIGVAFGITLLPSFKVGSVIGFGISGIVFGLLLCLFTYPFSGHFSFTIAGALIGASIIPLCSMSGFCGPIRGQGASICLLVGAIIGGTSSIWQAPLVMMRSLRKTIEQKRVRS